MTARGALAGSLLAVLAHPRWWLLALSGFLVRGGVLMLLLPLVPLPTTAGLANQFGPALVGFVFGGPSPAFLVLAGTFIGGLVLWLVLGGLAGTATDLELVREVGDDEELEASAAPGYPGRWQALALRGAAHVPTAAVLALGLAALVDAGYSELVRPGDPGLPVALRVVLRIPLEVGLIVVTWAVGEAVGGLAIRYLAWGRTMRSSLWHAVRSVVRPSAVGWLVLTNGAVALAVVGGELVASIAYQRLRVVLGEDLGGPELLIALTLLSLTWLATLWLVSLAAAWRSVAWTWEVGRRLPRA